MDTQRACGRKDCTDCPRQQVGRCHATPQQREEHSCSCGLIRRPQQETSR